MSEGPVLLKDQAAIDHDNEVELPKRRAANKAFESDMPPLRKAANDAGQAASRHWVGGFGHTKPELWEVAATADRAAAAKAHAALASGAFTFLRPGSLEYTASKAMFQKEPGYWDKLADDHAKTAVEAAANEQKIADKKKADEAAAAKAAKGKASAEKRKATIASKKAWAKT